MTVGKTLYRSGTISDANPITVDLSQARPPISVTLVPGSGNTSRWEYSITQGAAVMPGTAVWQAGSGDVTALTADVLLGPVQAVRFTRVSGSASDAYEVMA